MTTRVLLSARAGALSLALTLAACTARATPLVLPAGHPADPETRPVAVHAAPLAPRAPAATPAVPEEAAPTYVCPMHPEVTSTAPGACPKCGMALVPAKDAAPKGSGHEEHR